jgi:hypothetical protein
MTTQVRITVPFAHTDTHVQIVQVFANGDERVVVDCFSLIDIPMIHHIWDGMHLIIREVPATARSPDDCSLKALPNHP